MSFRPQTFKFDDVGAIRMRKSSTGHRGSRRDRGKDLQACDTDVLPHTITSRLHSLFRDIENEFQILYVENVQLREKISALEKGQSIGAYELDERDKNLLTEDHDQFDKSVLKSFTKNKAFKTRHKLIKAHTSKIVSSFKTPSLTCSLVKEYKGHRDGLWDISISRLGHSLIGTASADRTARVWGVDSERCLTVYTGHSGSVNAIAFHPTQDLVLTVSGDGSGHVWQAAPILPDPAINLATSNPSSEESQSDSSDPDEIGGAGSGVTSIKGLDEVAVASSACNKSQPQTIRSPISTLLGHQGVVIGCQWLNEDLAVTAGWDRVANLFNVETGCLLQTLAGHDNELTHVACHPKQRLVATCSTDSTFRLWDFRETIHSVSVFQGHTDSVTCSAFSLSDQIISGSDDRSVKVWDLRNMRAPIASIQTQSAVNRLDVSATGFIAVPHDNRQVSIYDLSGQKLSRLPRDLSKSHHRMVSSVCWAPDGSENWRTKANLFSAGFDRLAFGWSVKAASNKDDLIRVKEKGKDGGTL